MRLIATFCLVSACAPGQLHAQVASHADPLPPIKGPDTGANGISPSAPFFTSSPRATNEPTSLQAAGAGVNGGSPPKAEEQHQCLTVQYKCDAKCSANSQSASDRSRPVVEQQHNNCAARCHAVGVEQCKEAVGKVLVKRQEEAPNQKQTSAPAPCRLFNNPSSRCATAQSKPPWRASATH